LNAQTSFSLALVLPVPAAQATSPAAHKIKPSENQPENLVSVDNSIGNSSTAAKKANSVPSEVNAETAHKQLNDTIGSQKGVE
jgi:hypothetical protein